MRPARPAAPRAGRWRRGHPSTTAGPTPASPGRRRRGPARPRGGRAPGGRPRAAGPAERRRAPGSRRTRPPRRSRSSTSTGWSSRNTSRVASTWAATRAAASCPAGPARCNSASASLASACTRARSSGIDWPADQRGRSRNQRRVGGLGAALDNRHAAAHSVGHGTRGVLLTSPAELLAESVLHAPTVGRTKPSRRRLVEWPS